MPGPSSCDGDDDGRAGGPGGDAHRGPTGAPGGPPVVGGLAAVVDGVGHEVLERVGDAVEHAGVQLDVLALEDQGDVLAGRRGDLTHELGEGGDDPADRHHRQAHGAVAHAGELVLGVLDAAAQLAGGRGQLVPERHQAGDGVGHVRRRARRHRPRRCARSWPSRRARRPAGRRGRPDARRAGSRARPRRRCPAGRGRAASGPGPSRRCAAGRARRRGRASSAATGVGRGTSTGSSPGEGLVEGLHQGLDVLVADRGVGAGHGVGDGVGDREEQVHEVAADAEAAVLESTQEVLGAVGEPDDAVEGQRARRALHRVGVAEEAGHELLGRRVLLEPEQPVAQRGQLLVDLRAEDRDELRVVGPAVGRHVRRP